MSTRNDSQFYYASSDMYQLLSNFMFRTTPELANATFRGDIGQDAASIFAALGQETDDLAIALKTLEPHDKNNKSVEEFFHKLRQDFTHLFANPSYSVMHVYESRHFLGAKAINPLANVIALDVADRYKRITFVSSHYPDGQADHLGIELEYLQILRLNQGAAIEQGKSDEFEAIEVAVKDFFEKHLERWGLAFFKELQEKANTETYRAIGVIGEVFLAGEFSRT